MGDIVVLAGLKDIITGETLSDPDNPVILEHMTSLIILLRFLLS